MSNRQRGWRLDVANSLGMAALLMGNDANPVQAVGMGRLSGQDAPVELPGFGKTAFLVALHRSGEQRAGPGGRIRGLGLATGTALLAVHGSFSERESPIVAPTARLFNPPSVSPRMALKKAEPASLS